MILEAIASTLSTLMIFALVPNTSDKLRSGARVRHATARA